MARSVGFDLGDGTAAEVALFPSKIYFLVKPLTRMKALE